MTERSNSIRTLRPVAASARAARAGAMMSVAGVVLGGLWGGVCGFGAAAAWGQPVSLPAESPPPASTAAAAPVAPEASIVILRGPAEAEGRAPIVATDVSLDGVLADGVWIALDRVREIRGPLAGRWSEVASTAERAWRARIRLERGDTVGAEPLYEELFSTYAGRRGPTAAAAASGVLRCRLRRGVVTGAVGPWVAMLRAGEASIDMTSMDRATGLIPAVPPIWLNTPATQSLARSEIISSAGEQPDRAELLAALYQQAARRECGLDAALPSHHQKAIDSTADEGVRLVAAIVRSRSEKAELRKESRGMLGDMVKRRPAQWQEAWMRCAIGRSWLLEPGQEERMLGVAELLTLPAMIERVNPYLTGLGLAESAAALYAAGDQAGAALLRDELVLKFPNHPALDWESVRSLGTSARGAWAPVESAEDGSNTRARATSGSPGERER